MRQINTKEYVWVCWPSRHEINFFYNHFVYLFAGLLLFFLRSLL